MDQENAKKRINMLNKQLESMRYAFEHSVCRFKKERILGLMYGIFCEIQYLQGKVTKTHNHPQDFKQREDVAITIAELKKYNGKNGKRAYVAVNGNIYDVTDSAVWAAATHFGLSAGNELTKQFSSCHGNANVLKSLVKVGRLIQ